MEKINSDSIFSWIKNAFYLTVIGVICLIGLALFFQSDLRGVESNVIYSIQLALESNELLYKSPETPPFNISQYSPLYYIISDAVITPLSIESDDYFKIRVVTRIISVVFLLLSLYIIRGLLQNVIGVRKSTSLIIVSVYLIISYPWFNISRPDVLLLLFFVLSLRCVLMYQKNGNKTYTAILFGIFLALGVLSKLTMGLYIIAFGFYMILAKEWRLAIFSAMSFLLSLVLLCGIIQISGYDLTYIGKNIFEGIDNGTSFKSAWEASYKPYFIYFGSLSLIFILLSIAYFKNPKLGRSNSTLFSLIVISYGIAALSFFSALKVGSAINYFNELLLTLLLFMISILEKCYIRKKKIYLTGFMIFGLFIAINHTVAYGPKLLNNFVQLSSSNEKEGDVIKIVDYLKSNLRGSYFYSENIDIAQSFPNRSVLFPTPIHILAYKREVYNYGLVEDWAKQNLRFIIIHPNRKNLYGLDIEKYYSLKNKYRNYYLYELNGYDKN